jgi:hypothetical protein
VFIAYVVVASVLVAGLALSAFGFITRDEKITANVVKVGVPESWLPRLGALKAAGAAGLLVGLWIPLIGVAAAGGLVLYFLGAGIAHLRAKDYAMAPIVVICLLTVAALTLRLASS